jgi:hypothetical protein
VFIPFEIRIEPTFKKLKLFVFITLAIMFAVVFTPEGKKASETILWVNVFMLIPIWMYLNWQEHVMPLFNSIVFVRAVFFQFLAQLGIYLYWGMYNPVVIERIPLIVHQIAFGYLFQFSLSMFYERKYTISFSTSAAIMSANLFIWFAPKVYFFHYIIIVATLFGKMFLTRIVNGVERHIFNPSGLVSFLLAVGISVYSFNEEFNFFEYIYGPQMGAFWLWLPHFDIVVLIASCITLWTPNLYLIPMSCFSFLLGVNFLTRAYAGKFLFDALGKGSVFLGVTFLITDPATSPRSKIGQILYGITYAISLSFAVTLLIGFKWNLYYKKVFFICILNLLTPFYDRIGEWIETRFWGEDGLKLKFSRIKLLVMYIAFFAVAFNYTHEITYPPYFMDFSNFISTLKREIPNHQRPEDLGPMILPAPGLIPYLRMKLSNVKLFGIPLENHGPPVSQLPPSPFPPNPDFERFEK